MVSQIRLKISIFSDFLSYVNFGPDNRLYEKYFLCSPLKAYDSTRGSPTNRFLKPTSITMGIVWLMMSSTTQSNEYRAVKRNLLRLLIRLVISFSLYGLLSQIVERGSGLVLWPACTVSICRWLICFVFDMLVPLRDAFKCYFGRTFYFCISAIHINGSGRLLVFLACELDWVSVLKFSQCSLHQSRIELELICIISQRAFSSKPCAPRRGGASHTAREARSSVIWLRVPTSFVSCVRSERESQHHKTRVFTNFVHPGIC